MWPPPPQFKRMQTHRPPISAHPLFPMSRLHLSSPSPHLLTFSSFSVRHPPPPLTLQSQAVWLPVGSSHGEMYERGEKWMANSIKSIIPEAVPCYQRRCKGVLMHCLRAQPRPLPTPTEIKVVVVRGGGEGGRGRGETSFAESSETREGLFQAGRHTAVSRLPSPQGSCRHSGEKSSVRCQHRVQTRSESYRSD